MKRCSLCGVPGHNLRTCPEDSKPRPLKRPALSDSTDDEPLRFLLGTVVEVPCTHDEGTCHCSTHVGTVKSFNGTNKRYGITLCCKLEMEWVPASQIQHFRPPRYETFKSGDRVHALIPQSFGFAPALVINQLVIGNEETGTAYSLIFEKVLKGQQTVTQFVYYQAALRSSD